MKSLRMFCLLLIVVFATSYSAVSTALCKSQREPDGFSIIRDNELETALKRDCLTTCKTLRFRDGCWIVKKASQYFPNHRSLMAVPEMRVLCEGQFPYSVVKTLKSSGNCGESRCAMKVGHIYESGEFSFFSGMNPSRKKYYYSPYSKEVYTLGYHPYFDIDYSPDADGWKEDTTDSNLWVRNSKVSERTVKNEDLARQRHETVIANGIYRSSTESRYSRLEDIHVYSPYEGSLVNGHLKVVDTDPMTEGSIVTLEMNDTSHIVGILTPAKQIMFCENIIIGRVNSCGDLGIIIKGQLQPVEVTCDEEREPSFVDLLGVID